MRHKKSIIEIQFHWIFVLIAGMIILLFFTTLIFRQKNVSEQYLAADIINNLEGIITGASVSPKTLHIIETPRAEIEFTCEDYSIKGVRATTGQRIIFAPDKLYGRKLIPWALDWDVPFSATNFLFLATNEFKFVFVGYPDGFLGELARDFGTGEDLRYTTQFVDPGNDDINTVVKDTNNYKVRLIFYDLNDLPNIPADLQSMQDKDVTAINIIPYTDTSVTNTDFGTVEFYKKNSNTFTLIGQSVYLKKPSLIGAIFTENPEVYNCVMGKAFKRMNLAINIYKERMLSLIQSIGTCNSIYTDRNLNGMISYSGEFSTNVDNIKNLYDAIISLTNQNEALQLASCPTIY